MPFALLTGTVRSLDGVPIGGARLSIATGDAVEVVTADEHGVYRFPNVTLPATVEVVAPGFTAIRREVAASPADFTLAPASLTESVVVTAERTGAWRDPDTGATVLARTDLESLPAVTLDDAIHVVSGFSLFRRSNSRSSNPTTHGVTMRGLSASGSSRGLILLDGVPLNDGFGGWITWTRLPTFAVDRVDIERGAEGDTFGSDALGGVIRIVTTPSAKPSVSFGGQAGSLGVDGADFSIGGKHRDLSAFGATSWFKSDGAIPVEPASRGDVDRPSSAEWTNGFGRVDFASNGRHLSVEGWGGRDHRGNGTVLQVNRMNGETFAAAFDAAGAASTLAARVSRSPNTFYQTFSSVATGRATETLTSVQNIDATVTRAVVEFGRSVPRGRVLLGAALARGRADFTETKAATVTQALRDDSEAVSAQAGFTPSAHVTVGGALRHEWRAAPTSTDSREGATVGHVSAAWQPAALLHLRASAATSHRWPTLNELVRGFQAGSILTKPNPDLKPERAVSYSAAADAGRAHWQVSAGVFHTVVKDAIAAVTQTATVRQRQNAGEAHATGVELDGEVRPVPAWRVRVSGTLVNSTLQHAIEPLLEDKRLSQVPRASWSLTNDLRLPRAMDAALVWHATSSQFDDDRNQFRLASANQLDIKVGGKLGRAGWFVIAENATNARIEVGRTPLVTLAPPRAFRVGLTWRDVR